MDKNEAEVEAKALLAQELGNKHATTSFDGYAAFYMIMKRNKKTLTNSADLKTMMKLARLDQVLGTSIPKLILDCCLYAPKKKFIKKLLSLDTTTDKATAVKNVLHYTDKEGTNCLIACFDLAAWYTMETGEYPPDPTTGMMAEIEESVHFLIELGVLNNVDMTSVLNHTTNEGSTLLFKASFLSEKVATQLLRRRLNVNTVNHLFMTSQFEVSK